MDGFDTLRRAMATIDEYLEEARSRLERVSPEDLDHEIRDGALVVDIRPQADRDSYGKMPEAMVIDRNVLEWRLAPSSEARVAGLDEGRKIILLCNEGYQSSLSAAVLRDLDVNATDLIGGYHAWKKLNNQVAD